MAVEPLVSIIMITYGHEKFIAEAIEGVFTQQTNFPVELIIANDNSPDKTSEIVEKIICQAPSHITVKYTSHKVNKGMTLNFYWALQQAQGKYIAYCEGDDYWIDPLKLQKQVDFLEANSDYTVVVGGFISKHEYTKAAQTIVRTRRLYDNSTNKGYSFTLDDTYKNWITKVLTALHINSNELLTSLIEYEYCRDVHLFYHLLKKGKGFYFTEVFGVHRIHDGGIHSMVDKKKLTIGAYNIYNELYIKNRDEYTRKLSLEYHCMVLNLKIFNPKFVNYYNIKTSILLKNIIKLLKYPSDIALLYPIFIGESFKIRIKKLLKKT